MIFKLQKAVYLFSSHPSIMIAFHKEKYDLDIFFNLKFFSFFFRVPKVRIVNLNMVDFEKEL